VRGWRAKGCAARSCSWSPRSLPTTAARLVSSSPLGLELRVDFLGCLAQLATPGSAAAASCAHPLEPPSTQPVCSCRSLASASLARQASCGLRPQGLSGLLRDLHCGRARNQPPCGRRSRSGTLRVRAEFPLVVLRTGGLPRRAKLLARREWLHDLRLRRELAHRLVRWRTLLEAIVK
jgi:hypothetical protein